MGTIEKKNLLSESNNYTYDDNWGKDTIEGEFIDRLDFSNVSEHSLLVDLRNSIIKQDNLNEHTVALQGGSGQLAGTISLSNADATFQGINSGDNSGISVSSAGDINGDGIDDLLIGAYNADPNGQSSGETYLIYGKASLSGNINLLNADVTFKGKNAGDHSGYSVNSAGDINGDGIDDLLIGAYGADPNGSLSGETYLIFGKTNLSGEINLSNADATFKGINFEDRSGMSVSSAGDVNDDGYDDIIIAAYAADPNGLSSGENYLIYGKSNLSGDINLSHANVTFKGKNSWDYAGFNINFAGDVNGDGLDDILIGAYGTDTNGDRAGETYLIYGKADLSTEINLSNADVTFKGHTALDHSGYSVSSAGDVNGDGYADILIGAVYASPNATRSGESYLIYGKTNLSSEINLSNADVTFKGYSAMGYSGCSVSSAGDVNADGFDDILIGCNQADPRGTTDAGETYLVYGKANLSGDINLSNADATFQGLNSMDRSGYRVSSAGDINADGADDLLIGAYMADPNGYDSGESYLIYGKSNLKSQVRKIIASQNNDTIYGDEHNNIINAQSGNDTINSFEGNDTLNGGTGADELSGGAGNDYYIVDDINDVIIELVDEGNDRVSASVNYTLSDYIEVLQLTGDATDGAGNDQNNNLVGNSHNNSLVGNGGNDKIFAKAGNDILEGGDGNDYLSGGSGIDTMNGGAGNDRFVVDNINDVIIDSEGYDGIYSYIDYTLSSNIEKLCLRGDAVLAEGNDSNNWIEGTSGNNTLQGNKGNDYLAGNKGDDTYIFNAGDGKDRILDYGLNTVDTIQFGTEIEAENIAFFDRGGYYLDIKYGDGDVVSVQQYNNPKFSVENVELKSGLSADINGILNHIAAYEAI